MNNRLQTIGLGGSCHWCTEAIFQSLKGVNQVEQGWISSTGENEAFSEAILIHFNPKVISLDVLTAIHLYTHSCTKNHSMRSKYRSAIYTYNNDQIKQIELALTNLQAEFEEPIITQVLPFKAFKLNDERFLNYFENNPEKPFCQTYINPKLSILLKQFREYVTDERANLLDQ